MAFEANSMRGYVRFRNVVQGRRVPRWGADGSRSSRGTAAGQAGADNFSDGFSKLFVTEVPA